MADTAIEWCDSVWNPVRGCGIVSKGCTNCYAMKQAHRFSNAGGPYEGLTKLTAGGPVWTGKVRTVPEQLAVPLRWKKPRRVFVNSMSDLFHEDVPFEFIASVFAVMSVTTRHTYQVLTKRPQRMLAFFRWALDDAPPDSVFAWDRISDHWPANVPYASMHSNGGRWGYDNCGPAFPAENIWLGVSVEDQTAADERIPLLLQTPAAVRFISAEPLLGPVVLPSGWLHGRFIDCPDETDDPETDPCHGCDGNPRGGGDPCGARRGPRLDWIIVGGESGPGARVCDVRWIRPIVTQCRAADVSVFVKQLGRFVIDRNDAGFEGDAESCWPAVDVNTEPYGYVSGGQGDDCRVLLRDRKGGDPDEWPEDLRVREFPRTRAAGIIE